jgi:Ca2+-binding EF-hand superfamily protein
MIRTLPLLMAAALLLPSALHAQSANAAIAEARFKAADGDNNGKLSKAEAKDGMPRIHANFDRVDTNKDGFVTLAEIKAALAAAGQ